MRKRKRVGRQGQELGEPSWRAAPVLLSSSLAREPAHPGQCHSPGSKSNVVRTHTKEEAEEQEEEEEDKGEKPIEASSAAQMQG